MQPTTSDTFSSSTSSNANLYDLVEEARILCGKKPSSLIFSALQERLRGLTVLGAEHLQRSAPCLAVVLVGERKDSQLYVKIKKRMATRLGIAVRVIALPEMETTQDKLLAVIRQLNGDDSVDGVLVQVPLPDHLPVALCQEVAPEKDVDGFNYRNMGKLALNRMMTPDFSPCTPRGVIELLQYHKIELAGKNVVILGRSNVVGLPMSLMLLANDATVTLCHSKTGNLRDHTRRADILICAMGTPGLITADWIKDGAVLVDVGLSPAPDPDHPGRERLVGDVDAASVLNERESTALTPVPGGVGPMTVIMLMKAVVEAFERRCYAAEMKSGEH